MHPAHNQQSLAPTCSHTNPTHFTYTPCNVILSSVSKSTGSLHPLNQTSFSFTPPHTCCNPTHLIALYFLFRITLGEQYKSKSSSSCNFPNSPVISSWTKTASSVPYSQSTRTQPNPHEHNPIHTNTPNPHEHNTPTLYAILLLLLCYMFRPFIRPSPATGYN
jgi:hypothetical protein